MTLREILESFLTAALCVAVFFGLAWLMEPPEEPEPPQAAEYRALLDTQQQEREFNEWRESQSRHIGQQLAAIVAADKGESE